MTIPDGMTVEQLAIWAHETVTTEPFHTDEHQAALGVLNLIEQTDKMLVASAALNRRIDSLIEMADPSGLVLGARRAS